MTYRPETLAVHAGQRTLEALGIGLGVALGVRRCTGRKKQAEGNGDRTQASVEGSHLSRSRHQFGGEAAPPPPPLMHGLPSAAKRVRPRYRTSW